MFRPASASRRGGFRLCTAVLMRTAPALLYVFMYWRHLFEMLTAARALDLRLINICVGNKSRGPSSVLSPYVLSLKPLPGVAISSTICQRVEPAHQVQGNCRDGWSFRFPHLLGKRVA